jgi:hypothetical protein
MMELEVEEAAVEVVDGMFSEDAVMLAHGLEEKFELTKKLFWVESDRHSVLGFGKMIGK